MHAWCPKQVEASFEGCAGAETKGPPSPRGGTKIKPIQVNNTNTSQQATSAAAKYVNLTTSMLTSESACNGPTRERGGWKQGQVPTRTSHRCRMPPELFASNEPVIACEWKKRMDLVCVKDCICNNSIPRQAEERVSQVRRMDVAAESWGVVANRDIRNGDSVTVFGSTTYLQEASCEGAEFSQLHARMHGKASRSSTHSMATLQSQATIKCGPSQSPTRTPFATVLISRKPCAALSAQVEMKGLAT